MSYLDTRITRDEFIKTRGTISFIHQEEIKKIKKVFNQKFKKIRKLAQAKKETVDIVKWAVTNTDDDKTTDEENR